MKKKDIVRAWRDEEFRSNLSEEERARLDNPAGWVEVSAEELESDVTGGATSVGPPRFCRDISTCH